MSVVVIVPPSPQEINKTHHVVFPKYFWGEPLNQNCYNVYQSHNLLQGYMWWCKQEILFTHYGVASKRLFEVNQHSTKIDTTYMRATVCSRAMCWCQQKILFNDCSLYLRTVVPVSGTWYEQGCQDYWGLLERGTKSFFRWPHIDFHIKFSHLIHRLLQG